MATLTQETVVLLAEKKQIATKLPGIRSIELVGGWLWLSFSGKPDEDTRQKMTAAGFRFSGKRKRWYFRTGAQRRPSNLRWRQIVDLYGRRVLSGRSNQDDNEE